MNRHALLLYVVLSCICGDSSAMTSLVPSMSAAVESELFSLGGSDIVNLWQHAIRLQNRQPEVARVGVPTDTVRTIVAPHASFMTNLVPADAAHPLYGDDPQYRAMRTAFLKDSFIGRDVDPEDAALAADAGLAVSNMNNNELLFKKTNGALTVNGLPVSAVRLLTDGSRAWVVEGLLFGHEQAVREAADRMQAACSGDACQLHV